MTLTTHMAIAVAATKPIAGYHPLVLFVAGMFSHYLSDIIPHWDYKLNSAKDIGSTKKKHWEFNRNSLIKDAIKIGIDFGGGFAIIYLSVSPVNTQQLLWIAAASIGSALPDIMQGFYMFRSLRKIFYPLQKMHDFFHTKIRLGPYPLIGIPSQLIILALALWMI